MSYYLDTSAVVSALTQEQTTLQIQAWLEEHADDHLLISEWVKTEFSSALSIKTRTNQIDARLREVARAEFNRLCVDSFTTLPVTSGNFSAAAAFADRYDLVLRASDALHLAIAKEYGATICSFDRRLVGAASALNIPTVTP